MPAGRPAGRACCSPGGRPAGQAWPCPGLPGGVRRVWGLLAILACPAHCSMASLASLAPCWPGEVRGGGGGVVEVVEAGWGVWRRRGAAASRSPAGSRGHPGGHTARRHTATSHQASPRTCLGWQYFLVVLAPTTPHPGQQAKPHQPPSLTPSYTRIQNISLSKISLSKFRKNL